MYSKCWDTVSGTCVERPLRDSQNITAVSKQRFPPLFPITFSLITKEKLCCVSYHKNPHNNAGPSFLCEWMLTLWRLRGNERHLNCSVVLELHNGLIISSATRGRSKDLIHHRVNSSKLKWGCYCEVLRVMHLWLVPLKLSITLVFHGQSQITPDFWGRPLKRI